jgi:uncharacterized protein DUF6894
VPRFSFQVERGKFSNSPSIESILHDHQAAWYAGAEICADLVKEIIHGLTPSEPEWRVAVNDENGKTLFRFRLIAEAAAELQVDNPHQRNCFQHNPDPPVREPMSDSNFALATPRAAPGHGSSTKRSPLEF